MPIYEIKNAIQNYDWGDKNSIASILNITNTDGKPMAELWMGAHPKSPSMLCEKDKSTPLNEWVASQAIEALGEKDFNKYGQLPFLFKILAAGSPLSIQAHPNLQQAIKGFALENEKGVALTAFNRSYKDANHKPEMICALTPFSAMNGFRSLDEVCKNFEQLEDPCVKPLLDILQNRNEANVLKVFFAYLMKMQKAQQNELAKRVVAVIKNKKNQTECENWCLRLSAIYPGDIGVLCPFFLNIVHLKPGQSMFLEAGRLHSYLEGTGIELMANSDNVLRGGLTPKFVDVEELLGVLNFESSQVNVLELNQSQALYVFPSYVDEFLLKRILLNSNSCEVRTDDRAGILICLSGSGDFQLNDGQKVPFQKGQTFFVSANSENYRVSGTGELYLATTS